MNAINLNPSALSATINALSFYADEARWQMNSSGITSALDDKGFRAREALAALQFKPWTDAPIDPSLVNHG